MRRGGPPPPRSGSGRGNDLGAVLNQTHQGATLKKLTPNDSRTGVHLKKVSALYREGIIRQQPVVFLYIYLNPLWLDLHVHVLRGGMSGNARSDENGKCDKIWPSVSTKGENAELR